MQTLKLTLGAMLAAVCMSGFTAPSQTNKPPPVLADLKRVAILRLNEEWIIERDQVREETRISLKAPMLTMDDDSNIKIDVICYTSESTPAPEDIKFHIVSNSDGWRFLKYSAFIVNYDGTKKDFGELKVDGDVLPSGRVMEQMVAHFTYEEFHQMTYANKVLLNLGTQHNSELSSFSRSKWKALCNYFDLLKAEQKSKPAKEESKP